MRLPKRRAQILRTPQDEERSHELTLSAIRRLEHQLTHLVENERPSVVEDLSVAVQKGDLSENAEYQDARARLSRIDGRIFGLQERLKNAILINENAGQSGRAQIGSTVVLRVQGEEKTYQILGSQETNPSRGRISCLSPLGAALLDHVAHERITVNTPQGAIVYEIVDVK
ncbi:MAG: transcription elongation factor GreA [Patescibacteria group bacterium]